MTPLQALALFDAGAPCDHPNHQVLSGNLGEIWARCPDCGDMFNLANHDEYRQRRREHDEAVQVIQQALHVSPEVYTAKQGTLYSLRRKSPARDKKREEFEKLQSRVICGMMRGAVNALNDYEEERRVRKARK